jgi:hypothetical protein
MSGRINRKELAAQLGVSVKTLSRHESEWGLKKERVYLSRNIVHYPADSASRVFKRRRGQ